eukprot:Gb_08480 [translate_table: standard]
MGSEKHRAFIRATQQRFHNGATLNTPPEESRNAQHSCNSQQPIQAHAASRGLQFESSAAHFQNGTGNGSSTSADATPTRQGMERTEKCSKKTKFQKLSNNYKPNGGHGKSNSQRQIFFKKEDGSRTGWDLNLNPKGGFGHSTFGNNFDIARHRKWNAGIPDFIGNSSGNGKPYRKEMNYKGNRSKSNQRGSPSEVECPMCTEKFDPSEAGQLCRQCRFIMCAFCYHRVRNCEGDGRCPGCRTPYPGVMAKTKFQRLGG